MVRRRFTVCLLLALACAAGGCASPSLPEPSGQATIPVESAKPRGAATVKFLNEVTVLLPPLREPGHQWVVVLNDFRFLQPLGTIELAPEGGHRARFLALRSGRRLLRFFALPPGAKEASPSQVYEVLVTIE